MGKPFSVTALDFDVDLIGDIEGVMNPREQGGCCRRPAGMILEPSHPELFETLSNRSKRSRAPRELQRR